MMEFDAFISHSTRDKTAAHAACAVLEREGIRCWVAPCDIRPGGEYGAAIIEAIERCRVMVLIFSSSANASQQIHREIERAVSKSIPIVPVRIEEVTPTKSMEYFLGGIHWLDALTSPIEQHLTRLADTVNAILQVDVVGHAKADSVAARDTIRRDSGSKIQYSAYNEKVDERQADPKHASRGWQAAALALAVCSVLVIGGVWFYQTRPHALASTPTTPQPSQLPSEHLAQLVPETVPFVSDRERATIRSQYLPAPDHKALAISASRIGFTTAQR
jgi:TIR domain